MSISKGNHPTSPLRTPQAGSKGLLVALLLAGGMTMAPQLQVSTQGVEAVKRYEGLETKAYRDAVGVLTVCYGETKNVNPLRRYTEAECTAKLRSSLGEHSEAVSRWVTVPLTQTQFDALSSFVYNVGETAFRKSTLLRKLNNLDCWGAAAEYSKWVNAGGKKLKGLVLRRSRTTWRTTFPQTPPR